MRTAQKPPSFVLPSLKASTYLPQYASTFRSLRPSWEDFFTILWLTQPGPVQFASALLLV
jgi:hypothetical protein